MKLSLSFIMIQTSYVICPLIHVVNNFDYSFSSNNFNCYYINNIEKKSQNRTLWWESINIYEKDYIWNGINTVIMNLIKFKLTLNLMQEV